MTDDELMDHLLLNLVGLYGQRARTPGSELEAVAAGVGRLLRNKGWREIYAGSVRRCVEALEAAAEPNNG